MVFQTDRIRTNNFLHNPHLPIYYLRCEVRIPEGARDYFIDHINIRYSDHEDFSDYNPGPSHLTLPG